MKSQPMLQAATCCDTVLFKVHMKIDLGSNCLLQKIAIPQFWSKTWMALKKNPWFPDVFVNSFGDLKDTT
jgi:hypothetical protein